MRAENTASSFKKLLSVIDWEVRLLSGPTTIPLDGGKRRFIPLAFDANNGDLLPQRFQPIRMSYLLDNTRPSPFTQPTTAMIESWHQRAQLSTSSELFIINQTTFTVAAFLGVLGGAMSQPLLGSTPLPDP